MSDGQQSAAAAPVFEQVLVANLVFSQTPAQVERRKHFDKTALKELADSIAEKGIVQPIVVRRLTDVNVGKLEVIAGERRVQAAKAAKLERVPAMVHVLTDDQALDINLIENLQREDLHPLVEAEGYEDLRKRGLTMEQIAERVAKSVSYVYKRAELKGCIPEVREAFYTDKIDFSRALLLATIKAPDDQKACLKEITEDSWNGPMSFKRVQEHVLTHYRLRLDEAPFDIKAAGLVPAAGACGACPKNTAKQPADLFGHVSKGALCTDSKCWASKVQANVSARAAAAKAEGKAVLTGKAAKDATSYNSEFVELSDRNPHDMKSRTYRQLVGKNATTTLAILDDGRTVELIKKTDASALIRERGIKLREGVGKVADASSTRSAADIAKEKAAEEKEKAEEELQLAVAKAIYRVKGKPLSRSELARAAYILIDGGFGPIERIIDAVPRNIMKTIEKLDADGLIRLIRASLVAEHMDSGDRKLVTESAKHVGVNVERIKQGMNQASKKAAEQKPAAVPKKKSKKR